MEKIIAILALATLLLGCVGQAGVAGYKCNDRSIVSDPSTCPLQIVKLASNIEVDEYVARLDSVTAPTTSYPSGTALIKLFKKDTRTGDLILIKDFTAVPNSSTTANDGRVTVVINVGKINFGLDPASRWAEMSLAVKK